MANSSAVTVLMTLSSQAVWNLTQVRWWSTTSSLIHLWIVFDSASDVSHGQLVLIDISHGQLELTDVSH